MRYEIHVHHILYIESQIQEMDKTLFYNLGGLS